MLLNVFEGDAFNVQELTAAINRIPATPTRIGKSGLFESRGVITTSVMLEYKDKIISLIPTSARGTPPGTARPEKRKMYTFVVPHLALDDTVMADEVQNVRSFGTQSELQGVSEVVTNKIAIMRAAHEVTLEHHMLGAIKGVVLDADGVTVIHNLWTEFGVTPDVINFDFDPVTPGGSPTVKTQCLAVKRAIEENLGAATFSHIHCFCNSTFFDMLTNDFGVKEAYERWNQGAALRDDMRAYFPYGGIVFEEYPGSVGTTAFIPTVATTFPGNAFFFPVGVPGLFLTYFAPADYIETANTVGLEFYAKQERMVMDKGIIIETQSNPLALCTRPMSLVRATFTGS